MRRATGLRRLVHDAVGATTALVQEMHENVTAKTVRVFAAIEPLALPAQRIAEAHRKAARSVYLSVHGVNQWLTELGDLAEARLSPEAAAAPIPMRSDQTQTAAWRQDAALGALNGVVGDFLHARGNALDLGMQLRLGDAYVAPEAICAEKVALFLHGVCLTELGWCKNAEESLGDAAANFGTLLERDHGYTPVFLRYNSGRHISENGKDLAALLDRIACNSLILIGHSMGGLLARSASYYVDRDRLAVRRALSHIFCLGSPHHGADLEKAGNVIAALLSAVDVPGTLVPARLANVRSAGIKDLRYGNLIDEDWLGHDPDALLTDRRTELPLLSGVTYTFIATSVLRDVHHPLGTLIGDVLVRRASAHGPVAGRDGFQVHLEDVGGVSHFAMQSHASVYQRISAVLTKTSAAAQQADAAAQSVPAGE